MKKFFILLYIGILLTIFSLLPISFADTNTANAYNLNKKTVTLRIEGESENIFYDNEFEATYTDNSLTVLDAIEQAVGKENITTINSYYGGKYISKINNEEECILDNGEYAGWQYRVNGIEPYETVDQYILTEKDTVVVYFGTINTDAPLEKEGSKEEKNLSDQYLLNNEIKAFEDITDARVDLLVSMGVIKGEPDNKFYPDKNISRAEVITILAKLSGEEIKEYNEKVFRDTPVDEWYFDTIMWGYEKGIVNGYQNKFEPDEYITREDLAVMLVKYLEIFENYECKELESKFKDTFDMYDYSKKAIANLADLKLVNGYQNRFEPKEFATRYETVIILTNFLDMKFDDVQF